MAIIDAQVHCYERDKPERPWVDVLAGPPEVTGDDMVKAMDEVGVDAAILISPYTMYRYDPSYALECYAKHPTRFRLIKPFDPDDPAVAEQVTEWAKTDGVIAARIMLSRGYSEDPADPGLNSVCAACRDAGIPLNLLGAGRMEQVAALVARNPDTSIVIDHLGQPTVFHPPVPPAPFADLPKLLNLAQYPNVTVKITGVCTYSTAGHPYPDIWEPLGRVFDAFGLERCLWGTDWTRAVNLLTYQQGVTPFLETDRLSDDERAALMGGNLSRVYGWAPDA